MINKYRNKSIIIIILLMKNLFNLYYENYYFLYNYLNKINNNHQFIK